jgi:hypothetical protein
MQLQAFLMQDSRFTFFSENSTNLGSALSNLGNPFTGTW